jgi:hypothetical protein
MITKEKPRAFFYHYNKPASQRAKRPQISVHWKGACHIVDNIIVQVHSRGRVNKRQPYFVMCGQGVLSVFTNAFGQRVAVIL